MTEGKVCQALMPFTWKGSLAGLLLMTSFILRDQNALLLQVYEGMWRNVLAILKEIIAAIVTIYSPPHQWRSNFRAMAFSLVLCYYRNISSFNVIKIWNLLLLLVAVTVTVLERPLTPLSCGEEEVLSCQVFIWMLAEEVIGGGIKRAGSQRHSPEACPKGNDAASSCQNPYSFHNAWKLEIQNFQKQLSTC